MREPRLGVEWSPKRASIRRDYAKYVSSPAWYRRRRQWLAEHREVTGEGPVCTACGQAWRLSHDDLHHRSYRRLGHELAQDLVPMCRPCHYRLHVLLDSNPEWKHVRHEQATDMLIAHMRKEKSHAATDHQTTERS